MSKKRIPAILVEWQDPTMDRGKGGKATITATGVKIAQKMARAGHPMRGIAATMGLGVKAFTSAVERQPELQLAMDTSLGMLEQECVNVLLKAMREGAFVPAIFMLKSKFMWREQATPTDAMVQVNLQIPQGMTRAEAAKLIREISPKKKPEVEATDIEFEMLPAPGSIVR